MINQLKEMEVVRQQIKREGFESLEYIKDKLEHLNFDDHLGCYVEKNGKPVGLASWVNGAMYGWEEGRNSTPEGFVLMPVEPTLKMVNAYKKSFDEQKSFSEHQAHYLAYKAMLEASKQ